VHKNNGEHLGLLARFASIPPNNSTCPTHRPAAIAARIPLRRGRQHRRLRPGVDTILLPPPPTPKKVRQPTRAARTYEPAGDACVTAPRSWFFMHQCSHGAIKPSREPTQRRAGNPALLIHVAYEKSSWSRCRPTKGASDLVPHADRRTRVSSSQGAIGVLHTIIVTEGTSLTLSSRWPKIRRKKKKKVSPTARRITGSSIRTTGGQPYKQSYYFADDRHAGCQQNI